MIPERQLWASYINSKVIDALGGFKVPGLPDGGTKCIPPLEEQYEILLKKQMSKEVGDMYQSRRSICKNWQAADKARYFLETSHFDDVAGMIGYDSNFVNKTFNFVQEAITLEKMLWEKVQERRRNDKGYT